MAEDTVRVIEELFGTFADHFQDHDGSSHFSSSSSFSRYSSNSASSSSFANGDPPTSSPSSDYFFYSSPPDQSTHSFFSLSFEDPYASLLIILSVLKSWVLQTVHGSTEDVVGVSSVIPQIMGTYVFLWLLSAWLRGRARRSERQKVVEEFEEARLLNFQYQNQQLSNGVTAAQDTPTPFNTPVRGGSGGSTSIHHHHHHHHGSDPVTPTPFIASVVAEKVEGHNSDAGTAAAAAASFETPQIGIPAKEVNNIKKPKKMRMSFIRRFAR